MKNRIFPLFLALFGFPLSCAFAEDSRDITTDELSVLEERLANESQGVTVLDETETARPGRVHLQDALDYVPNLSFSGGSNRPRFFQIRGVGELERYESTPNSSIPVLIDGIDTTNLGSAATLFDTKSITVTRGPAGFSGGPSGLGGSIALESNDPTSYYSGLGEFSVGSDELLGGGVAFGGPIDRSDKKVQFRVSAAHTQQNGFRHDDFLNRDDTNQRDELTARMKIKILASDAVAIDIAAFHINLNNGYDAFAINNSLHTQSDKPGQDDQLTSGAQFIPTIHLSKDLDLVSKSSTLFSTSEYSFDGDWGNNRFWAPFLPYDYFSTNNRTNHTLSQELSLRSRGTYTIGEDYRWIAGTYLARQKELTSLRDYFASDAFRTLDSKYSHYTRAGFGELDVPILKDTALTFGGRIEDYSDHYSDTNSKFATPQDTMYGGSIGIVHALSKNLQWRLSGSEGFKSGGFNPGILVPDDQRIFDPESMWTIDTGISYESDHHILYGSANIFYAQREDEQVKLAFQNDPTDPLSYTFVTDNSARGQNTGGELSLGWKPTDRWQITTNGSLLFTKFLNYTSETLDLTGREQSHAPTWQYSLGNRYYVTEELFGELSITGKDRFYFDDSHNQRSTPYHLVNASIGVEKERWSVALWAKNLLDKSYAYRGFYFGIEPPDFPNKVYIQRGDPFQVGVTLTYHF